MLNEQGLTRLYESNFNVICEHPVTGDVPMGCWQRHCQGCVLQHHRNFMQVLKVMEIDREI